MSEHPGRLRRLRNAGVIYGKGRLPKEYADVIDGLSETEVEVIVDVTKQLREADKKLRTGQPSKGSGYDVWSWIHF
jgi:hypothetical protein